MTTPRWLDTVLSGISDTSDRALAQRLYGFVRRSGVGGWDNYTLDNPNEMAPEEREDLARTHGFRDFAHFTAVAETFADIRNRLRAEAR